MNSEEVSNIGIIMVHVLYEDHIEPDNEQDRLVMLRSTAGILYTR